MADRQSPSVPMLVQEAPLAFPVQPVEIQRHTFVYRSQPVPLHADVYRPAVLLPEQRRLAVIMIHGGPVPKDSDPKGWRLFRDYATLLAGIGVITVVFNHRLHGQAEYFTAHADVVALLEHVRRHAQDYNIDPERLLLWAFAGGGPLLAAVLDPPQPHVCGLVAYYCLLDFATPAKIGAQAAPREILDRLSPLAQLRRHGCNAPMLIARAGRDSPVLNRSIDDFLAIALLREVPVELLNHPTGEHAFDVCNHDARTCEIIGRTLEFIRTRAAV
jgi:acetyl esterase/lipase